MTQMFWEEGIPFMVGIKPVRKGGGKEYLSQNTYLPRHISSALASGGTALLEKDGESSRENMNERIEELIRNDILPLGFLDAQGEGEGDGGYPVEDNFSTLVRPSRVPFFFHDGKFQTIVPLAGRLLKGEEAAGYPGAYREARRRCVLRDAVLGFTVGADAEKGRVRELIKKIKKMGYAFLDLRYRPNYVRASRLMIVSEPSYYEELPVDAVAYGTKSKMDLMRFEMTGEFLTEKLYTHKYKLKAEKAYSLRLAGTALIDIPAQWGILVVQKEDKAPSAVERIQKPLLMFLLGKNSKNLSGEVYRIIVLLLFLVTFLLMIYLLYMFFFEEWVRKTFRGI